jgi:hypothetical protein
MESGVQWNGLWCPWEKNTRRKSEEKKAQSEVRSLKINNYLLDL